MGQHGSNKTTETHCSSLLQSTVKRFPVITTHHREGNNNLVYNLFQHSVQYLKTAQADKNPFEIASVDRYESAVPAPEFLLPCVQIYYRLQRLINNPSLVSLFHLDPLFRAQASSGGNIGRVFVPWLAFGELSIQMCLLCPCGSDFWNSQDRLKPSDLPLNGFWVQGMTLPKRRPVIDPHQGINFGWNRSGFPSTVPLTVQFLYLSFFT